MANPTNIRAIALLDEPARRRLYDAVIAAPEPLSRDDAAAAAGVSRALAAFHLDRLVEAGLLVPEYRRRTGRVGPGAGRPAKLYRAATVEFAVSLPDRHYEVPARLFAAAVELSDGEATLAVRRSAHELGASVGDAARSAAGPGATTAQLLELLMSALVERGYAPQLTPDGEILLANCPFHGLVVEHRVLVCGMNLALAEGLIEGLGIAGLEARLDPRAGLCCVVIGQRDGGD